MIPAFLKMFAQEVDLKFVSVEEDPRKTVKKILIICPIPKISIVIVS